MNAGIPEQSHSTRVQTTTSKKSFYIYSLANQPASTSDLHATSIDLTLAPATPTDSPPIPSAHLNLPKPAHTYLYGQV